MKEIHQIQKDILKKLLFQKELRYSQIKPIEMESSQFKFHLDALINEGLIEKKFKGLYSLTLKGKNDANRIGRDSTTPTIQAKLSVCFACSKNNDSEFLIYKRLKNPFYGCQGFPTGKVQYGEEIYSAAKRKLKEETNLEGEPLLIGIRHFRVFYKETTELLEDKVMYIFKFTDPKGDLISDKSGEFKWIKKSEIQSEIENPLEEFYETYDLIKNFKGEISFKEVSHYTLKF